MINQLKYLKKKAHQIIHWMENQFKIDFFYLIKGEFWLMSGKTISLAVSFLLSLAWANWIDKSTYGIYQYIFSLVGIISIFSLPGLGTAIIQAVARGFEGSFLRGFKIQFKWGLLGSLSALGISGYYWLKDNETLFLSFLIIAIFLPLFNASIIYVNFLMGRKLFNIKAKYDSIVQVIAAAIMILTLFFVKNFLSDASVCVVIFLIVSVYFVSRTFLRFLFFAITKIKFKPNLKEDPKTINFGKHLTLSEVADTLSGSLDKILLFHYLGATELAIYSFATLMPQQITVFLKHISALAMPKFSVRNSEEIKKTILKKIYYLTLLMSIFVLVYIIFAPLVYQTFFPKYLDSVPFSKLYALSIIPLSFAILDGVFKAKMMTKQIYQMKIIAPLIRIGLLATLVPIYGIWGAVWGILGARISNALMYLIFFKKI